VLVAVLEFVRVVAFECSKLEYFHVRVFRGEQLLRTAMMMSMVKIKMPKSKLDLRLRAGKSFGSAPGGPALAGLAPMAAWLA
jgi:hypothetical protein